MITFGLVANRTVQDGVIDLSLGNYPSRGDTIFLNSVRLNNSGVFIDYKRSQRFSVPLTYTKLDEILDNSSVVYSPSVNAPSRSIIIDMTDSNLLRSVDGIDSIIASPVSRRAGQYKIRSNEGAIQTQLSASSLKSRLKDCLSQTFGASFLDPQNGEQDVEVGLPVQIMIKSEESESNINFSNGAIQLIPEGQQDVGLVVQPSGTDITGDLNVRGDTYSASPIFVGMPEKDGQMTSVFPHSNLLLSSIAKIPNILKAVQEYRARLQMMVQILTLVEGVKGNDSLSSGINKLKSIGDRYRRDTGENRTSSRAQSDMMTVTLAEAARITREPELAEQLQAANSQANG